MLRVVLVACLAVAGASNSTHSSHGTPDATTTTPIPETNSTKEILKASETADPSKVEIVKQIRRLNPDGSYTVGYEADDGTFKIESRDVLGNVKGTFGRPLGTVVYPTRGSYTTRGTNVQAIPRRRIATTLSTKPPTTTEMTTEKQQAEESTSNILNLYKPKEESVTMIRTRSQMQKPISRNDKDDLITRQTTTKLPHTVKPVYEHVTEEPENDPGKANTIRRELTGTSQNPHMLSLQQSAGDDSTDVYGSHLSLGTVRPLFTTTTPRPRLVPIHSLVAARQRIQQQYQDAQHQEQETTIEASTGRVFDHENVVTSNPVPVVHIPQRIPEERFYQQPIYRRPQSTVQFRTNEYLRDNPGAPIPIGNQRPFLQYEYQNIHPQHKVLEPHFVKESHHQTQAPQIKGSASEAVTAAPYDNRQVTRIIPIAVDERGVPIQGYQRFVNPYRPAQPQPQPQPVLIQPQHQPRYDPIEEMNSISAPVSTRDLKRLLQILILRQNRLQALMDQIVAPGPPYQPLPLFRAAEPQYEYTQNRYQTRQYPDDERYDYRYEQQQPYRQQEVYQNQVQNYEPQQYESQRYVPRRRLYTRPYDTQSSSSNRVEETPEYLPPEIREALLLKMLMLAISPDFMPTPQPLTELTTAAPTRKQVRNVQILGEEGSAEESKKPMQMMQRH
ncbi:hypothetical protein NE865_13441 [Phthorimaea operculella]|nr:hypothetical protein NE865_13441 [Phthorimaea operculella]